MGKGTYKSVNQLIEQGYHISESNVQYAGEAWEIVDPLLTEFDDSFDALRTAQALCMTTRIDKEAAVEKAKLAREAMEHSLVRLKRFIGVVADEDFAEVMIHELGIDVNFPDKDEDFVTLIMSSVIPRLGNWDGTPQKIAAAIKTEVNNAILLFRTAVLDSADKQSEAETATADRDEKQEIYEDVLTKIRKWLYLMLPNEREDQHLEEYGFEAWGGESPGNGDGTKWDDVPAGVTIEYYTVPEKMLVLKVAKYEDQTGFDVEIAWGETGGAIPVMSGENTMTNVPFPVQYVDEIFPGKTCYACVRARKDDEVTDWADVVSVDVPG